jgi:hypothetical protein
VSDRLKVIYIMGTGRCGSTLLDNALGSIEGLFSTGELHKLWSGAILRGAGCGCGQPVVQCPVWSQVLSRVGLGDGQVDPREVWRWQLGEARVVHTPRLLRSGPSQLQARPDLARYRELMAALHRAIVGVTGADVIVDSSKTPADAAILSTMPEIDLTVVHLVRDPRAVAHSWQRRRSTNDPHRQEQMFRLNPAISTVRWDLTNLVGEQVRRRVGPGASMVVRYEDFVERPRDVVAQILELASEEGRVPPFVDAHTVRLTSNHTVWGNRSRFLTGEIRLQADEEWRRGAPLLHRGLVTALALPWLGHYGYRWATGVAREGAPA